MSLLKNLKNDASIQGEQDRLGGGGAIPSSLLKLVVSMAYITVSDIKDKDGQKTGGAMAINFTFKTPDGKELNDTQYITGGVDKGQKNTYLDKDQKEQYLPGYLMANAVSELTTGLPLNELDTEDKLIEVYDFQAKAKTPKKLPVVTSLIGKEVYAGVLRVIANKRAKQDDGSYKDTNDQSTFNEINKIFCAREGYEYFTAAEIRAKKADSTVEPKFYQDWKEKYDGKDSNRFKEVKGGAVATSGGTTTSSGATAPKASLFN